ncbi:glycosyltransferase family 4 protein [Corynebacterium cystitidis]|uniref:Phosphatidylinositol alpha-mannosyltransferase n=1 Tax=Corynebacterium cystitidis DSM 20524 TaxID=1121357 RepID=A0A1H9PC71_9CORY|nr:glycosyltransferase family 4 protein [Corynebacterium cystitidis]WJY82551.1 GDP-mannose-dependent alpha-(1-2)-phosphatidylinositol mannosyltransferase [Corynebacterium cystitidis DSM 20524]SER45757.1 Phosphatidylinositol alpha-mannosyltransferase [Corynebacterium cystitidis DSM 20524]SNV73522.1 glycosyl transferase [Corynebacterium cystitidis]
MRIGIVCPYSFDEPGGVQAHILDLAEVFRSQGHYVGVLGPASAGTDVPEYVTKGGGSVPIRYNGSVARLAIGPQVISTTRWFLNEGQFDVLHIHEPNSPSFSMASLFIAEGPIVATYHASAASSWILSLARPLLQPKLEKIGGGIAVSEMARRLQVEKLGGDPVLIPNGVDTARFAAARRPRDPHAPVEIVFLGRLDESRKGLDILLRALAQLDRKVTVTVIGGGRPREFSGINFVGRVSDQQKAEILGRADIYVAPNTGGESFGIVLVEAMAAGCAVVASDLEAFAAVCDITSEEPAGVLFPVGDDHALAMALRMLIDDEAARQRLIESGLKRSQLYDWDTVAAKVMAVYETVADGTTVRG